MPFSPIIPPSPSPTESKSLFFTSVSLLLSRIQGYHCHLSKFHIYVLVNTYCKANGTPLQHFCLENPTDGGAWWAAVHGVTKSQTRLSDFTFTFHFQALEKEMATHSSVLAWRIPGTGEPGGLPSMVSHRVGHDWNDLAAATHYLFPFCRNGNDTLHLHCLLFGTFFQIFCPICSSQYP